MTEILAPCVAVVGPPNSGKTSLLHLLDRALQIQPPQPLVYVVKGNPDGTGRYLFHAPELRERLKERVKGVWCATTVETVCGWVESCRRHLDLVLVVLGGRHAPGKRPDLRPLLPRRRRGAPVRRPSARARRGWSPGRGRAGTTGFAVVARLRSVIGSGRLRIGCLAAHHQPLVGLPAGRADPTKPGPIVS